MAFNVRNLPANAGYVLNSSSQRQLVYLRTLMLGKDCLLALAQVSNVRETTQVIRLPIRLAI